MFFLRGDSISIRRTQKFPLNLESHFIKVTLPTKIDPRYIILYTMMSVFLNLQMSCDNLPITIPDDASLHPYLSVEMFQRAEYPYEKLVHISAPLGGVRVVIQPDMMRICYPIPVYVSRRNDKIYVMVNTGLDGYSSASRVKFYEKILENPPKCIQRTVDYYAWYLAQWIENHMNIDQIHWHAVQRVHFRSQVSKQNYEFDRLVNEFKDKYNKLFVFQIDGYFINYLDTGDIPKCNEAIKKLYNVAISHNMSEEVGDILIKMKLAISQI